MGLEEEGEFGDDDGEYSIQFRAQPKVVRSSGRGSGGKSRGKLQFIRPSNTTGDSTTSSTTLLTSFQQHQQTAVVGGSKRYTRPFSRGPLDMLRKIASPNSTVGGGISGSNIFNDETSSINMTTSNSLRQPAAKGGDATKTGSGSSNMNPSSVFVTTTIKPAVRQSFSKSNNNNTSGQYSQLSTTDNTSLLTSQIIAENNEEEEEDVPLFHPEGLFHTLVDIPKVTAAAVEGSFSAKQHRKEEDEDEGDNFQQVGC
jgi:hypothetical protein